MQNPEPSVEFDTVANKKQQHEINVGKLLVNLIVRFIFLSEHGKAGENTKDLEGCY